MWLLDRERLAIAVRAKRGNREIGQIIKEIGVGPGTLQRIESGKDHDFGVDKFFAICYWLGIKPWYFVTVSQESEAA